ncbi:MAG: ABC transporter permease [Solobacterium sp.]|nr:ABC transporter permease [Solobacterium sp.]MDY2952867.1 ABC transporter permease [Erysipelotrichaceae bacterium]MCI6697274.1 ABC transporter permease [Solobacterium sp.]MCI6845609.1 ABC transporter permease [Solobacterium sp.]MCI6878198.1 ABC transporter permease [Solobacterium sp.]
MAIVVSALSQGLLWSVLAVGVYLSYRFLNISDLTSEGSFTLGAAVCASNIVRGMDPLLSCILALIAGALAGLVTGVLHTKFKMPSLLAGILSMTGLYSINLRIMGKANIPLTQSVTLLTKLKNIFGLARDRDGAIYLGLIVVVILIILLVWFFNTEFGFSVVATGNNDKMIRANGVDSDKTIIAGLMLSNALIALSGSLVAQYNGYADVTMGIGAIVVGLASVIIGEVLFKDKYFAVCLIGVVVGSIIYRLIVTFVVNTNFISANDMKLFTAIVVAVAIIIANKGGKKRV